MRTTHHDRDRSRQNADPFIQNHRHLTVFTQWGCTLVATPPQVAASSPPIGGNDAMQGCDTPTTRRKKASHGAKPPPPPAWSAPGAGEPGRSAREQRQGAAIARQLAQGLHQSTTLFAQQQPRRAPSGQNSPSTPLLAARAVQNSPRSPTLTACAGQNSPSTPLLTACAVQNSPRSPTLTACAVQNSPCSPEMAQFGAVSACRESFVPF